MLAVNPFSKVREDVRVAWTTGSEWRQSTEVRRGYEKYKVIYTPRSPDHNSLKDFTIVQCITPHLLTVASD